MQETSDMRILMDWITRGIIMAIVACVCIVDLLHNRKPPDKYPFKFVFFRLLFFFFC
jgi:hypothetical protein